VASRLLSDSLVIVLSMADRLLDTFPATLWAPPASTERPFPVCEAMALTKQVSGGETGQRVVSVIDPDTSTVSGIPTPSNQACLALDRDWNTLYTGNFRDNSVSAIDLTTRTVLATIGVGWNPANIAIDNGTRKMYVANRFSDFYLGH
jgi:YVTN family beta-propeller protein